MAIIQHLKPHIIAAVVAVIFLGTGYVFLQVYTDFSVNKEKLTELKSQEKFLKYRISELNRQNKAVKKLGDFVMLAKNLGVTDNRWDDFSVNLSEESMAFQAFESMLEQTHNSAQYYFLPVHLDLRPAAAAPLHNNDTAAAHNNQNKSDTSHAGAGSHADLTINLRGAYLIRN